MRRCSLIAAAFLALSVGALGQGNKKHPLSHPRSYSADPQTITVSGSHYNIPSNFIFLTETKDDKIVQVSMRMMLPEMQGLTPSALECFQSRDTPCAKNVVRFSIMTLPTSSALVRMRSALRETKDGSKAEICGLQKIGNDSPKDSRRATPRYYYYFVDSDDPEFGPLICPARITLNNWLCHAKETLPDGNTLHISLDPSIVCEWPKIRSTVHSLIKKFKE